MTAPMPRTLTTERLTLRQFELGDLEGYVSYYTGPRTGGVGGPKPRYIVVERFMAMLGQWALRGYGRYAIALDGRAIGHTGVMHWDNTDPPELTWTLWRASDEGQGYASEAARAALSVWQGAALVARIAPDNLPSQKLALRIGMIRDLEATPPSYDPSMWTYVQPEQNGAAA